MKKHVTKLKRELNLFEIVMYGVGIILGAGIYALIGEGAALAGNALWLAFGLAALIACFTGLSYAELSSMYPKEAAEYVYTKKAFNKKYLSFIVIWILLIAGIVSSAVVALGFGGYLSNITGIPKIAGAIILIACMSLINFYGMKESSKMNIISTIIEILGLVIIVVIGFMFFNPKIDYFYAPMGFEGIISATALIFFAFIGFESIANISEEAKKARKIIPLGLVIALVISTAIYMVVSVAAVSVSGAEALSESHAPMTDITSKAFGPDAGIIMSIIALFATGNTVLIILIVTSRILYGTAQNRALPKILCRLHKKRKTPYISIFLVMLLAVLVALPGNIKLIASLTDIGIFIVYFLVICCFLNHFFIISQSDKYKK